MLFYMNSKVFEKDFINYEYDEDILKANYILVSHRILSSGKSSDGRKFENISQMAGALFPSPDVLSALVEEDARSRYYEQLEAYNTYFAAIIKDSIEENNHYIFLCTLSEDKNYHFFRYLQAYIYTVFDYPLYNYKIYQSGKYELVKYNKEKVLKKCNSILKEAKRNYIERILNENTADTRYKKKYLKRADKSDLKKYLKNHHLYRKDMNKKEMIETIILFCENQ